MHYIYELTNPTTGLPFYIGRTINPKSRLYDHKLGNKEYVCSRYIKLLKQHGIIPRMNIVASAETSVEASWLEMFYILEYSKKYTILNEFVPTRNLPERPVPIENSDNHEEVVHMVNIIAMGF